MVQDPMAGGYTAYGAMDAMYPWATYAPNQALTMALAQYQGQNALAQQAMQSNASMANAATAAGASVAGAQIGAQGQLDAQYIQSIATLQGLDASIKADLIKAAGGDQNDINKLNATLAMQANIANQNMGWNLAQAAGSGNLMDNFARMRYLGGTGPQPGFESALNGLPSPWVTAPTAQFTPYGAAPNVNMSLPQFSVGNGGWSGGGANQFAMPNVGNLGAMYSSALPLFPTFGLEFGAGGGTTPPTAGGNALPPVLYNAPGTVGGNAPGIGGVPGIYTYDNQVMDPASQNQITSDYGIGALNAAIYGSNAGMASGGTVRLGANDAVQVGEGLNNEGVRMGTAEILRPVRDGIRVMPQIAPGIEQYRDPVTGQQYDATGARSAATGDTMTWFDSKMPQQAPNSWGSQSPLQLLADRKKAAAATKAEADAVLAEPDPTPNHVDNAVASTSQYDAGLATGPTATEPGALTPGGPTLSSLPFFQSLMTGNVGPAWNANIQRPTAPWLGINEGVPLPFEASNTFHRSNPANQAAMMQLWQALGIPPETAQYWIRASTPGARFNNVQALGF